MDAAGDGPPRAWRSIPATGHPEVAERPHIGGMPTKRPDIIYALPPKRNRRPKAKPANMPKGAKRSPKLATRIVDHGAPEMPDDEQHQRGDAADALFQEVKRWVIAGNAA
jgi:hypothetical protein